VTIDVKSEPGATLARLAGTLYDEKRRRRLERLDAWYRGEPPLPGIPDAAREAMRQFMEETGTNYPLLIVEAVRNRQRVRGIRTAADDDVTGDGAAWQMWLDLDMPVVSADVHRLKARFGEAYAMVSPPREGSDLPIVTPEDPRHCVGEPDPLQSWLLRTGLKAMFDPATGKSRLYLSRPGRLDVAESDKESKAGVRFSAANWSWNDDLSGDLPDGLMPMVRFEALDGLAEFEPHERLLRRIQTVTLNGLSTSVLQAFRQRVIKGLPVKDKDGNPIDYTEAFPADPASVWLIPASGDVWESGQVDLTGVLAMNRDNVRQLSGVSSTPLSMLDPSGENQSAEGAALSREGLVFKVEDRNARDGLGWRQVIRSVYRWRGEDVADVSVIWAPPQRSSLAERASAMSQASGAGVPLRTNLIMFGEFDPAEVDRAMQDKADEQMQERIAQLALAAQQAQAAPTEPAPSGAQRPAGATNGAPASTGNPSGASGAQGAAGAAA
jgi:hypothetical protein